MSGSTDAAVSSRPRVLAQADRRIAVCLARTAAGTSAVVVVAVVLFFAVEVTQPLPHVFGPVSDIGTVGWDLLAAPLIWGVGTSLPGGGVRIMSAVAAACTIAGAVNSLLLVAKVMPPAASWGLSVAVLVAQCWWLFVASGAMRRTSGWSRATTRLGRTMAGGQAFGAVVVCGSLLLGWGSPAQVVILVAGAVPGALGWIAWPAWFLLLGRDLASAPADDPVLARR